MSKKRKHSIPVQMGKTKDPYHAGTITAEQLRNMRKGRLLPTSGFGIHGDVGYNRCKQKAESRRIIDEETK